MAKKPKSLIAFSDMLPASEEVNDEVNSDVNNEVNEGVNTIETLLGPLKKKKMRGIHFEMDLLEIMDSVCKKRGDQSTLVNEALRSFFKANGLL